MLDVGSHGEAAAYLNEVSSGVRDVAVAAHGVLAELGCSSYVKTIYVGYDHDGEMVAALYGRADYVEIALALPEDADGALLVDASHLTWRTLPVAAILRDMADVEAFAALASDAVDRVRSQRHDVRRENEYFIRRRRERRARR